MDGDGMDCQDENEMDGEEEELEDTTTQDEKQVWNYFLISYAFVLCLQILVLLRLNGAILPDCYCESRVLY
ncbi:unnamed protein product [Strongylus vulgaris]|uniref:Uncharacterized protein n=1 Tax=Strongylus vulgaris TaxID=40348 RepID=A0A3P7JG99_STRVU|nr:unnamed protein product [Strongylus vulgaris]